MTLTVALPSSPSGTGPVSAARPERTAVLRGSTEARRWATTQSPLGDLLLVRTDVGLSGIYLPEHRRGCAVQPDWQRDETGFADVKAALNAYFTGDSEQFDLALDPRGTPFQHRVWEALRAIPYGRTRSYGELAAAIGAPGAARAVGMANARNPLSIVVPCHRVIGGGGALTGYAGGMSRKSWLLEHERARAAAVAG